MELNDRILELNVQGNLQGQAVKVKLNGKDILAGETPVEVKHIIQKLAFKTGELRGNSIFEFYTVKDGFLVDKEGNQINFSCERFPDIKINRIKTPILLNDEVEVDVEYIKNVCQLLNIQTPEDTIRDLSDEEKKAIVDEREARLAELETKRLEQEAEEAKKKAEEDERLAEEARKAEEEANTKAEIAKAEEATRLAEEEARKSEAERIKAEKEAEEAKKAEEEAKLQAEKSAEEARKAAEEEAKRIAEEEKDYVMSAKQYDKISRRDIKKGYVKYEHKNYIFFYMANPPKGEKPYMLKKRDNGTYEELVGGVADENAEEVEFEFEDNGDKTLILNIENEEITIESNED